MVVLHPGTVGTSLSRPFQARVQKKLFSPNYAAGKLIGVMAGLSPTDSGKVFAWDGVVCLADFGERSLKL